MQIRQLPEQPSLENLRKQAKGLLKAVHAGASGTRERVGPFFGDPSAITLQKAQLVIAREYGFSSWTALKRHIEGGAPEGNTLDQLATRFLDLVCLAYREDVFATPQRFDQAAELLARHPEIASASIHTAAAVGDAEQIDRWLDKDPALICAPGGFYHWPPLMYACYARLPGVSSFPAAKRLLARGADPNAHYMWGGTYKFTALTGVFGQGEGGPINLPEHPETVPFAQALLDAGAEANDSQVLYNRCFEADNTAFKMLLGHGLAPGDRNNWEGDDGHDVLHFHLIIATRWGFPDRVKLLVDAGADLNKRDDTYDTMTKGETPYQSALLRGQGEIAAYLKAHGADAEELTGARALQSAIMLGQTDRARDLMRTDPEAAAELEPRHGEMLRDAANTRHLDALRTMIALGFNLNPTDQPTPLHTAAYKGNLDVIRLLIDAGADTKIRDPEYFSPPLGHAIYSNQADAIALLEQCDMDIFGAAARGRIDLVDARLAEDPECLEVTFGDRRPSPEKECGNDWATPLWFAAMNGRIETVQHLLALGANPAIVDDRGTSLPDMARASGQDEAADLIAARL